MPVRPSIIPCLTYDDAPAAIEFLCDAFGFSRHAVYASEDGRQIHHAQLMLGGNLVMLSSINAAGRARSGLVTPAEVNGRVTGSLYVVIDDVDAHHAIAAARGAPVIAPPHDNDYGGRGYEVRDSEGYFWSFGSYDPFA